MKPTCVDLFAGCGGLSLGLERAGMELLFAVEGHPDAFASYSHNLLDNPQIAHRWPAWLERRAWRVEELLAAHHDQLIALRGKVDVVAGGPPCQGFSMNGQRRPDDPRNEMLEHYLNYVRLLQPKLILLENVRGFASMPHREGNTYADYVCRQLKAEGYECWFDIILASEWGVPQKRPRFVLIAALRGSLPGINPLERLRVARRSFLNERGLGLVPITAEQALSDFQIITDKSGEPVLYRTPHYFSSFQHLMRQDSHQQPNDQRLAQHRPATVDRMQQILASCQPGSNLSDTDKIRFGIRKRSITPLAAKSPAPTITTLPDDFIHYAEPRTMTVREHARLQSFPDWFSFRGPYSSGGKRRQSQCPRYTQVANAVPPLLAEALGEMLLGLLRSNTFENFGHFQETSIIITKGASQIGKTINRDVVSAIVG